MGEELLNIDGFLYHFDCVDDLGTREILNLLGVEILVTEVGDSW